MITPTVSEIHERLRQYLAGKFELNDFDEWVMDWESLPEEDTAAWRLMADLGLMFCEMTCSGSYRTEQMFREDAKSILAGKPPVAFWSEPDSHTVPMERIPGYFDAEAAKA